MLALRPNDFDREDRRDFAVLHLGKVIGHIYSGAGLHGGQWLYAIYGWGSDLADDLEDAKAKLKAQFEKLNSKPTQIANR